MLQDEDYVDTYTKIQDMVQAEILNLVKGRIESTPEGKELLQRQLKIVKKLIILKQMIWILKAVLLYCFIARYFRNY